MGQLDGKIANVTAGGGWIERHQDLLVTGPTGTGKTWLSCTADPGPLGGYAADNRTAPRSIGNRR